MKSGFVDMKAHVLFDSKKILRAMDRKTRNALMKVGRLVRWAARDSLRKRKGPSRPGEPPHVHGKQLRQILYAYDPAGQEVVIGPKGLSARRLPVPAIHEFGADVVRRRDGKVETAEYPARPYMLPALEENASEIPEQWRGGFDYLGAG